MLQNSMQEKQHSLRKINYILVYSVLFPITLNSTQTQSLIQKRTQMHTADILAATLIYKEKYCNHLLWGKLTNQQFIVDLEVMQAKLPHFKRHQDFANTYLILTTKSDSTQPVCWQSHCLTASSQVRLTHWQDE